MSSIRRSSLISVILGRAPSSLLPFVPFPSPPTRSAMTSQISAVSRRRFRSFPPETMRALSRHCSASRRYSSTLLLGVCLRAIGIRMRDREKVNYKVAALLKRGQESMGSPLRSREKHKQQETDACDPSRICTSRPLSCRTSVACCC
jgi:hypothetical protein